MNRWWNFENSNHGKVYSEDVYSYNINFKRGFRWTLNEYIPALRERSGLNHLQELLAILGNPAYSDTCWFYNGPDMDIIGVTTTWNQPTFIILFKSVDTLFVPWKNFEAIASCKGCGWIAVVTLNVKWHQRTFVTRVKSLWFGCYTAIWTKYWLFDCKVEGFEVSAIETSVLVFFMTKIWERKTLYLDW